MTAVERGCFVDTPFGRVYSERSGTSGGPPVLLVHGLGTSKNLWADVTPMLEDSHLDVIAVDNLGHGRSDKPQHLCTLRHYARAVASVISTLGVSQTTVVGNSMGAQIGFALAAAFPDRVAGLIPIGCPGFASSLEAENWLVRSSDRLDLETGLLRHPTDLGSSRAAALVDADRALLGPWYMHAMWAVAGYDLMSDLGIVRCPVKVVYGEADWLLDSARNLTALPAATLEVVKDAGHHAPLDAPEAIATIIIEFTRRISSDRRPG